MLLGVVNAYKPQGMTSRKLVDVVLRKCPRKTKVGHAGTLDPMATGVLVIAVGPATKLIQYSQSSAKTYEGSFRLGFRSDTEDATGQIEAIDGAPTISRDEFASKLPTFEGTIQQTPPSYSAIKVGGERAYKAARKGVSLDIAARPVRIDSIELLDFDFPNFSLRINCGKGTYIRTLGRDIAKSLGSDCLMTKLERTAVGEFSSEESMSLEDIENQKIEDLIRDPVQMVNNLERVSLQSDQIEELRHGRRLKGIETQLKNEQAEELVAVCPKGKLLAILVRKSASEFGPKVNFVPLLFN